MSLIIPSDYNPSSVLFGLEKEFINIVKLHELSRLPKVLMLSGDKGIGKFTLVYHFLTNHFDKNNYDLNELKIDENSFFTKQFLNNIFPNIIYVRGSNLKIEEIRNLKTSILKTSIVEKDRFVIFDDIELLNTSCCNALLKIIEEPSVNNYFILINNKKKKIIETIHSRSIEFKISLKSQKRVNTIKSLIKKYNLDNIIIDYKNSTISPGNFLKFNNICSKYKINLNIDYLNNFSLLLNLYKKEKNYIIIDLILYLTEIYFYNAANEKGRLDKVLEDKTFVINNLNKFLLYNINQNSLINAINSRFLNE